MFRKQLIIYYFSFLIFFLLISLSRQWFSVSFLAFWIGGAIGAILPDVDHLIYVYFLKPHELTSQRAVRMISKGQLASTFSLLANTREERTQLIFHTAMFQLIFAAFCFFVVTSSDSLLGRGIVLSFFLHLLVDQYLDLQKLGTIAHWFKHFKLDLTREQSVFYWAAGGLFIVICGFVF